MIVYTSGYPRSGSAWLDRLLSDLLDAPITNLPPDEAWVTDFCATGQSGYIVRKTHWQAHEWDGTGKMIFIQRDPRDVAVSAMFYRELEPTFQNLKGVITTMIGTGLLMHAIYHEQGAYEKFVRNWLNLSGVCSNVTVTKYEWLHDYGIDELWSLFGFLTGGELEQSRALKIVDRQRFDQHARNYPHSMRKGIAGDWRNYFKRAHGRFITRFLGGLMLDQGYINDLEWWRDLPA